MSWICSHRRCATLSQREVLPYRPKVLAITGTNGKTTVTSLTGLLLQRAGLRVAVAGNIGPALLDVLSSALDTEREGEAQDAARAAAQAEAAVPETPTSAEVGPSPVASDATDEPVSTDTDEASADDEGPTLLVPPPPPEPEPQHLPQAWVLELSSFQLDGTAGGPWDQVPTAATVLNISEDHLDWHGSHGRLRTGQGGGLRHTGADAAQPRRPPGDGDGARFGHGQDRWTQPPATRPSLDQFRPGHPRACGRMGHRIGQRHGVAGALRWRWTKPASAAGPRTATTRSTSSA